MADDSMQLMDGQQVTNDPSSLSAYILQHLRARLDRPVTVLRRRGQQDLARLAVALAAVDLRLRDAMSLLLNDEARAGAGAGGDFSGDPALFGAYRRLIRGDLLTLQERGFSEHEVSLAILPIAFDATMLAAYSARRVLDDDDEPYRGGGGGGGGLEKQTFSRAGAGGNGSVAEGGSDSDSDSECSICLNEFVDGEQVSVMPCPSRGHMFHPYCIAKWLGIHNTCPLCRHVLPAY